MSIFSQNQYKTNPTIFSRKKLELAAKTYRIDTIPNIEEKKQKLSGWIKGILDGTVTSKKEEAIGNDFLNLFFGEILDYDFQLGEDQYNLEKQLKNQTDSKKSDGALGYFNSKTGEKIVKAVIELKDGQTDLDKPQNRKNDHRTPVQQAFDYASDAGGTCNWVIVSNFVEIRLYNYRDRGKYELFYITEFLENEIELKRFFYLMYKTQLISKFEKSAIDRVYEQRQADQQTITTRFYNEYKQLRIEVLNNFRELNPDKNPLWLLEKTQKLLDRIIFICFCEDAVPELIPGDTIKKMLDRARDNPFDDGSTYLWRQTINLFGSMDKGNKQAEIQPFNGGLFAPDPELDALKIDSFLLIKVLKLYHWDFESELNVNVLGHIFEQSISDLEDLQEQLSLTEMLSEEEKVLIQKDKKRKKDGVFYTPEYITKYMVEESIGTWLEERKQELNFENLQELTLEDYQELAAYKTAKSAQKKELDNKFRPHREFWLAYKSKLDNITVLDPACGSGAFLIQVFDYLFAEQKIVAKEIERLFPEIKTDWWEVQRQILMKNLYGVDLNFESVEITKLSLWIKTANKTKPLSFIDHTIMCGNSLIDDSEVAGNKAFNWQKQFPEIFEKGGFDVVIGNPPYVDIKQLPNKMVKYFFEKYECTENRINLYSIFIERGIQLINENGVECFINPNSMLVNSSYFHLRKKICDGISLVTKLPDNVFEEATVETIIFVYQKNKIIEFCKSIIHKKDEVLEKIDTSRSRLIDKKNWNGSFLTFNIYTNNEIQAILKKCYKNSIKMDEIVDVSLGITPYDKYKGHSDELIEKREFHSLKKVSNSWKPLISGQNIQRYYINNSIAEYIKYGDWLGAPRNERFFTSERLIVRQIISGKPPRIYAGHTNESLYFTQIGFGVLAKSENFKCKFLLCLINSTLINFIHKYKFIDQEKEVFQKILIENFKQFPIKNCNEVNQLPFIQKADEMLLLNEQFQKEKNDFLKIFSKSFSISKITTKMENWYETNFLDFQNELKKQKIEIPIKERLKWIELFEETQLKIKDIQLKIAETDKEIDAMVYALYELTPEEIKVVEGL